MKKLGNVFILGDSYSTFTGFIPEWCASYYLPEGRPETDVTEVSQTWWHRLLDNTDSHLVLNSSFSGTTVCHTGYDGSDCSARDSFCARLKNLVNEGFFADNDIDTFFIFGGTNDCWANSPIGEIKLANRTEQDLFSFSPALCHIIETVKSVCPNARIIAVVNDGLKPEISETVSTAAAHYGIQAINLKDIDKREGHPTIKGMEQIYSQIINSL